MNSIEGGRFENDPSYKPERLETNGWERGLNHESNVDMRLESELFQDHERLDNDRGSSTELARLRDTLAEESDGILYLKVPEYDYDFTGNPFIGMGPHVRRTYAISRYLDVVFLHRYMYHDILVCGIRSRECVDERGRAAFVRHIRDTGGAPINLDSPDGYDFLAMKFSPYVASDTTAAWFTRYHKQEPLSHERPHYPVDIWMIYDANAYDEVPVPADFRKAYALKPGYDRAMSLLGIAQIN